MGSETCQCPADDQFVHGYAGGQVPGHGFQGIVQCQDLCDLFMRNNTGVVFIPDGIGDILDVRQVIWTGCQDLGACC